MVLGVFGYVGAFLTAFYAFRMVFRVFYGEPVPEARELEGGHLAHGEPMNPMTGEPEDTDVGFPGPEHHVAERAWPMKAAMAPLALLAIVGGVRRDPGRGRRDRELPRADLRRLALPRRPRPATAPSGSACAWAARSRIAGIGARLVRLRAPAAAPPRALRRALPAGCTASS